MNKTDRQPWLLIVSGPNGAGKSTFYKYVLSNNPFLSDAIFINYDNEIKQFKSLPEYSAQYEKVQSDAEYQINTATTNAAATFKKQMEQIGGNLNERITQPFENKEYWYEQYRIFTHIPVEWEHIKPYLYSKKDLAQSVGGKTIHDRINAKSENNDWYPVYKKLIHNLEVQKTIITNNTEKQIKQLDSQLRRQTLKKLRTKIDTSFENKKNIIFETTGAGIVQINKQGKTNNYKIFGYHISVLHPEISVSRVQQRVQKGGHDVPTNIIFQRHKEYLEILPKALPTEDIAIVIDNSGKKPFMPIFALSNGYLTDITTCPEYLQKTHQQMQEIFPQKPIDKVLHLSKNIDIKKLTDEQRENFGQIIMTNLLGLADSTLQNTNVHQTFLQNTKEKFYSCFKKIFRKQR